MYETYTRQPLPSKEYRELLGSAICVFNANTSFIIENLMSVNEKLSWYTLMDQTSGKLFQEIEKTLNPIDSDILSRFKELTEKRNRIIHGFQGTEKGIQILFTKTKNPDNEQFLITKQFLMEFIKLNEEFCDKLHNLRVALKSSTNKESESTT